MRRSATAAITLAALAACGAVLMAGPLSPPIGAVGPTMKTLDTVEPRIAISDATTPGNSSYAYAITQPGSYYLTGDVNAGQKIGIAVRAANVTIDLNGFNVTTEATHDGAAAVWFNEDGTLAAPKGFCIRNGTLKGGGYCVLVMNASVGGRVENVAIVGGPSTGIAVGQASIIKGCTVTGVVNGIDALAGSIVEDCTVNGVTSRGISVSASTVRNCTVRGMTGSSGSCIQARGDCLIEGNNVGDAGTGQATIGIECTNGTQGNRIQNNHVQNIRWGVYLNTGSTNNFVVNNTVRGTVTPFVTSSVPNAVAPVISGAAANFNAINPFSNFSW
ncbi:MAG: right-handed parallel beta-helix repeat-containing protein [Phycisphaerales bacterium]